MEKSQRSASEVEQHGELTEQRTAQRVRARGILPWLCSTSGNEHREFMNLDINAAINTRRCAVLETRPEELTRSNLVRQPLRVEVYNEKLKTITDGRSNKAGKPLHVSVCTHTIYRRDRHKRKDGCSKQARTERVSLST